ncbi:MAG: DNA-binding protein [Methylococcales bacterium]|nr:DNA-binding protein [Methylococcales bacterium]
MATQRLTEEEVHAACADIAAQGERPTALILLDRLGRGSLTTITKYLNSWNTTVEAQAIKVDTLPAVVKLPQELSKEGDDLLKRMWHVAKSLTDAELDIQREALKQAEIANQTKVEEAFTFSEAQSMKIDRLEDALSDIKAQLAEEQSDHAETVAKLIEAEKANVGLSKDNDQLRHEISALKSQVATLEESSKAAVLDRQELQQKHDTEIKQKDAEIRSFDMQVNNLQSSLDSTVKANDQLKTDIKEKASKLSAQVIEFEKLNVRYESTVSELKTVKSDLKAVNKAASDAGKLVANLEGQLEVYKSLDKSEKR